MDKIPGINSVVENDFRMYIEKMTIGKSVMSGAIAIKIPLILLPFNVSEMTIANKGPGAIPAAKPKVIPYIKYSVFSSLNLNLRTRSRPHDDVCNIGNSVLVLLKIFNRIPTRTFSEYIPF